MLESDTKNPFVAVTHKPLTRERAYAMGFVYQILSPTRKLVVTCRHVLMHGPISEYVLRLGAYGKIEIVSPAIFPSNENMDLGFVIVEDLEKKACQRFTPVLEQVSFRGKTLSNVKCIMHEYPSTRFDLISLIQPITEDCRDIALHKVSKERPEVRGVDSIHETEESLRDTLTQHKQNGYETYPLLKMYSERGFSGSPIFDEKFNLYGVTIGGFLDDKTRMAYASAQQLQDAFNEVKATIYQYAN